MRRLLALPMAAVMVAVFITPAQAADDQALATIVSVTGSPARDLSAPEAMGNDITAQVANSSSGSPLRTLVQPKDGGAAVLAVLNEPGTATFTDLVPAGSAFTPIEDGAYHVVTPTGDKLTIRPPWATDAAGQSLPTQYVINGTAITQTVDTTGAVFPVVADPTVSFGWFIYVHFNRSETFTVAHSGAYAVLALTVCRLVSPVIGEVTCGMFYGAAAIDMYNQFNAATRMYHRCAVVELNYAFFYNGTLLVYC